MCYGLIRPWVGSPIKYSCVTIYLLSKLTPYSTEPWNARHQSRLITLIHNSQDLHYNQIYNHWLWSLSLPRFASLRRLLELRSLLAPLANWLRNTTFDNNCTVTYPPWNRTLQSHDAEERWSTPTLLLFNTLLPSSGENMKCRGSSGKDGGLTFTTAFIFWVYFQTLRSTNLDDSDDRHAYDWSVK